MLLVIRSRGALMRATAFALLILALANPSFTREDRDPIPSVAAVVIDKSPSQGFGDRAKQTEEARTALTERLARIPNLDVRVVDAGAADGETDGTRLFNALGAALADVPPDRIAGAFMITDGRVHDVPTDASALGFAAPLHALVTGVANETRPQGRPDHRAALRYCRPVADHRFPCRGSGRRPATAQHHRAPRWRDRSKRATSTPMRRRACRSRSRMPDRTSSRSKPRRWRTN